MQQSASHKYAPLFLPLLLSHYLSTQYMFTLSHLPIHLLFYTLLVYSSLHLKWPVAAGFK